VASVGLYIDMHVIVTLAD